MNKKIFNVTLSLLLCISLTSATFLTAQENIESSLENTNNDLNKELLDTEELTAIEEANDPAEEDDLFLGGGGARFN